MDVANKESVKPNTSDELTYKQLNAFDRLLDYLQLNHNYYKKIERVISQLIKSTRSSGGDADALLQAFAKKCYASDPDSAEAERFLETLYGTVADLYSKGAKAALKANLDKQPDATSSTDSAASGTESVGSRALKKGKVWKLKFGKYLVGSTLGKGGTSVVRLGMDTETEELVAVKILNAKGKTTMDKEVAILKCLDHPNILRVRDSFKKVKVNRKGTMTDVFILDFAENGEVIDYLIYTKRFEEPLARWYLKECLKAIEHNFERGVLHRDIKHDNVLLAKNFHVLLADYGFAINWKEGDEDLYDALGTACYAAPELLKKEGYNQPADVYSLGVMLFVALIGRQPFKMAAKQDKYYKLVMKNSWDKFWKQFPASKTISDDAKELMQGMLQRKPNERITVADIKKSRWYNGPCLSQEEASDALTKRKLEMDAIKKKRGIEEFGAAAKQVAHRGVGDAPTALFHWSKNPEAAAGFKTEADADDIMNYIRDTINKMKGKVTVVNYDDEGGDDEIDLTEAGLAKINQNEGGMGLLDDPVEFLADGSPNKFKADFELLVNGNRIAGSYQIFTEQLSEAEEQKVARRINDTAKLLSMKNEYQQTVLAKMMEADDKVPIATLESRAKEQAKKFLAEQLGESEWISKEFYTESDRRSLGKKNIVQFNLLSIEKSAPDLSELVKGDLKSVPKWYSAKGIFRETLNRIMEMNSGLIATS